MDNKMNLSSRELARKPRPHHPLPPPKTASNWSARICGENHFCTPWNLVSPLCSPPCCTTPVQSSEDGMHDLASSRKNESPNTTYPAFKIILRRSFGRTGPIDLFEVDDVRKFGPQIARKRKVRIFAVFLTACVSCVRSPPAVQGPECAQRQPVEPDAGGAARTAH